MKKCGVFCAVVLCCALALGQTPQVVSEVHVTAPKPGMSAEWEAGRARHSAFHAAQKDTWSILVWEITTGERAGSYIQASPNHNWKDFDARDAFNKLDAPDVAKNITPYSGSTSTSYFVFRDDLSLTKPPATPPRMRVNSIYWVIPSEVNTFTDSIKKINEAIKRTNYPAKPSRWYQLANGGDTPTYVLVSDRASWGDMEPAEKQLSDALKEVYGDARALDDLRKSTRRIATELAVFRPDLSYMPK